jgi:hypothetical protein
VNAQIKKASIALALAAGVLAALPYAFSQATQPGSGGAATPSSIDLNKPIATINDRDINNKAFYDMLMQVAGYRVYEEVRDWVLIQQACTPAGIPTTGEDFQKAMQAEIDKALQGISQQTKQTGNQITDKEQLVKIMNQTLAQRGITQAEFMLGIQRAAGLRQLAKGHVEVTNEELHQAFDARYGEKVEVDVMSVADQQKSAEVRELIKQGKKPLEISQAHGVPVQSMTISKNADQIPQIRDAAFRLNPGELSGAIPAVRGSGFVLIYLQRKIPADTTARFDDPAVQKDLKQFVFDLKEQEWMNNHLNTLRGQSNIKINDPTLSAIVEANVRAQMAAQSQPATAPAGTGLGLPAPSGTVAPGAAGTPGAAPARGAGAAPSR